jgi:hypothetical protein
MQGKEAKHSEIKYELKNCSNRGIEGEKNKWYQLMQASFVRTFYLPYHFPIKTYQSHYDSRNPTFVEGMCGCCREINMDDSYCEMCVFLQPYMILRMANYQKK